MAEILMHTIITDISGFFINRRVKLCLLPGPSLRTTRALPAVSYTGKFETYSVTRSIGLSLKT